MDTGGPVTGVLTARLLRTTIRNIQVAAELQGVPPATLVRQVLTDIFGTLPEDVALGLELRQRIEQLQPAQQAETA